ncbi:MAG: thioredoxin [Candidatus Omnitrophica bacterium]|nr:thioredoxin [Candidatus Omnitrophota bacterium]
MDKNVIRFTDENFDKELNSSNAPLIVDFWAEWCGPCKMFSPIVDEVAKEYIGKLRVGKLDVDANPQTPTRFGVMNIPTVIFFKDNKECSRLIGAVSKKELIKRIEELLTK